MVHKPPMALSAVQTQVTGFISEALLLNWPAIVIECQNKSMVLFMQRIWMSTGSLINKKKDLCLDQLFTLLYTHSGQSY